MKPKYIENSMMLTKEAFAQYIQNLKEERAKTHGMTIEEWDNAVMNGGVVEAKPSPYVHPYETNNTTGSQAIS
jgi:hypothetical protein